LIDPEGHPFIHVALNSVSIQRGPQFKKAFPGKYRNPEDWAQKTMNLLARQGFNGTGCWSNDGLLGTASPRPVFTRRVSFMGSFGRKERIVYQQPGHLGYPRDLIPVFDPAFEAFCRERAGELEETRDDPYLLGIFSDNELPFPADSLDRHLELDRESPGRRAAGRWLESRRGPSWKEQEISPGDREAWLAHVLDRYLSLVRSAIRRVDPNHLYLGPRFHGSFRRRRLLWEVAGKHLDAIAINVYGIWSPAESVRRWTRWSGKPVIVTEWYAKGQDSGMLNLSGAGWTVHTQKERGYFYQHFTLSLIESQGCVGWHYFKYADNDPLDRSVDPSNRNSNKGILNARYEPYRPLLDAMKALNSRVYPLADHFDGKSRDVVVYGGTSAGVVAAVQTARMGKTVLLIEPGQHLGGLTSGGLGRTDTGNKAVIGGISREFYRRLKRYYDDDRVWIHEKKEDYRGYDERSDAIWGFEPGVAERLFEDLLREAAVPVVKGERLDLKGGVTVEEDRIISIRMESGKTYRGKMFLDATYEGDLMAGAGVTCTVGREANARYGETLNGIQKARSRNHQFIQKVDPYIRPGDPASGLLPGVQGGDPGKDGDGDRRVQAYCFRLCLTDVEENRVPYPKPAGYDPLRYELLLRNLEAGDLRIPWLPGRMPNRKTDTNNRHAISLDNIGMNYSYPEGDYATREKIIREHEVYQKGLLWTLANHPRVPEGVRREISRWGLARDEFTDNGNWPHQLYIREARRMVGEYVMTELDCRRRRIAGDPVGLGSYNMDSHNCQRYVTPEGFARNEGNIEVSPGGAYLISYRSIIPRRGEVKNLLVPVCLSASHIAYGSIRMEPVFMILGQSAATAAVQALEEGKPVQDVEYAGLRRKLLADGQVLDLP